MGLAAGSTCRLSETIGSSLSVGAVAAVLLHVPDLLPVPVLQKMAPVAWGPGKYRRDAGNRSAEELPVQGFHYLVKLEILS